MVKPQSSPDADCTVCEVQSVMWLKVLTTCRPLNPAARSWRSPELRINVIRSITIQLFDSKQQRQMSKDGWNFQLHLTRWHLSGIWITRLPFDSPTNSGVPKMSLKSTPSLILCAKPKSISLILGFWILLSSSMIFSGCKKQNVPLKSLLGARRKSKHW